MLLLASFIGATAATVPNEMLLRDIVVRTALAQALAPDPHWEAAQRDCAGLVRFSYREAFRTLAPQHLDAGLWRDRFGKATAFADAETLLAYNFKPLGRDETAQALVQAGDLLAFRQTGAPDEPPVYHLLLAVRSRDKASHELQVVYHPGRVGAAVSVGALSDLLNDAPREWHPVPENPAFLGYFRLNEWMNHD